MFLLLIKGRISEIEKIWTIYAFVCEALNSAMVSNSSKFSGSFVSESKISLEKIQGGATMMRVG